MASHSFTRQELYELVWSEPMSRPCTRPSPSDTVRPCPPQPWLGLEVTVDGVANLRLALIALLPNVSGLVLAFAIVLHRQRV
jgi:hypothetical protein